MAVNWQKQIASWFILGLTVAAYAAFTISPLRPARTSRPGIAPVCWPRSKIGVPATSVTS